MKSLTIGIPAHNEEHNLPFLLRSITAQKREGFVLDRIFVACDGCSDRTVEIARRFIIEIPELEVIDDGRRVGQAGRINEMMHQTESDIFVSLDADTVLERDRSLSALAEAFSDPRVGLAAAADRPHPPRTFFESVAVTVVDLWRSIRTQHNGGDSIHNAHGCALALSRAFFRQFTLPTHVNGADNFLYLKSKELGLGFRYVQDAVVLYHEPATLHEYLAQRRRFHNIHGNMGEIFGRRADASYASMPKRLVIRSMFQMFLERPIRLPLALLLEIYSRLFIYTHEPLAQGGVWQTIQSTK